MGWNTCFLKRLRHRRPRPTSRCGRRPTNRWILIETLAAWSHLHRSRRHTAGARPGRRHHRRGQGPRRTRRDTGKRRRSTLRRGREVTRVGRLRRCAALENQTRSGRWHAANLPELRSATAQGESVPPTGAGAGLERGNFLPRRRKEIVEGYRGAAQNAARSLVEDRRRNLQLLFLVGALVRQSPETGSARRPALGQGGTRGERMREERRRPCRRGSHLCVATGEERGRDNGHFPPSLHM
jgi:hypothetical protein